MKLDMHCHTKEGSLDCKLPLADYIDALKENGYDGMLITDHNSYNAYRYYKRHRNEKVFEDFVVLKGIEYDTIDAGHILVIMPEQVRLPLLELRGLPVALLIEMVHRFGGILGPAHPCGEKYLSLANTKRFRKTPKLLGSFDFMETFNACEAPESNQRAEAIAYLWKLPGFGGSDSHKADCVGMAYTEIDAEITCESDLIAAVKAKAAIRSGGSYYEKTTKARIGKMNTLLIYSFWVYNKTAALLRYYRRRIALATCDNLVRHI